MTEPDPKPERVPWAEALDRFDEAMNDDATAERTRQDAEHYEGII